MARPSVGLNGMPEKTNLVRFKPPGISSQLVLAESAQIHEEHLIFLHSNGKLAALFFLEIVESWSEFPGSTFRGQRKEPYRVLV